MAAAQAQQSQIDQAHAQAAQAAQTTLAANKKDITEELQKLASLRQQGILSEDEFQQMNTLEHLRFYQI